MIEDWFLKFSEMSPDGKRFKSRLWNEDRRRRIRRLANSGLSRTLAGCHRSKGFHHRAGPGLYKDDLPSRFQVKWSVVPMFKDVYIALLIPN